MRKKIKLATKYRIPFLITLMVLLAVTTGMIVYAALVDKDTVTNTFRVSDTTTEIEENFPPPGKLVPGKEYKKEAWIKNQGEADVFLRVLVIPKITKIVDGETILLFSGTDVLTFKMNHPEDWVDGGDGYFYYMKKLGKGEVTSHLLDSVTLSSKVNADEYADAKLEVELKVEGISTTQYTYRDAWWKGVKPLEDPLKKVDAALAKLTSV